MVCMTGLAVDLESYLSEKCEGCTYVSCLSYVGHFKASIPTMAIAEDKHPF